MANLKEIRTRITSVNSTMQITSAMKMVSAAKLKRAQNAVVQMRPYAEKLQELLQSISASIDTSDNVFIKPREVEKILIVALTSNRGLCGGFNNAVIKQIKKIAAETTSSKIEILPIGKKGYEAFKKGSLLNTHASLPANSEHLWDDLSYDIISPLAENLMERFNEGSYDKIILVYNSFKNAGVQLLQTEQFLPIVNSDVSETNSSVDYIFEPSKEEIITHLIPNSLKIALYKAMLDSRASEHGARMTAMHKATDNASELITELKLYYNKARQASITNEILEIVGGAEALNN